MQGCRKRGKPVIVATNMLESMIDNPTPTRAEVSDIAIAVREGTDAIMLSGETAYGKFPLKSVAVMSTVAKRTESSMLSYQVLAPMLANLCVWERAAALFLTACTAAMPSCSIAAHMPMSRPACHACHAMHQANAENATMGPQGCLSCLCLADGLHAQLAYCIKKS